MQTRSSGKLALARRTSSGTWLVRLAVVGAAGFAAFLSAAPAQALPSPLPANLTDLPEMATEAVKPALG
ncbi:hypothetical protein [Streptomyces albus]|uniref:hypothetical protein n=1 Tax=Streptomyces albus TaxID=1888 RepID=UPI003F1A233F